MGQIPWYHTIDAQQLTPHARFPDRPCRRSQLRTSP
jgi:hypothetical protein